MTTRSADADGPRRPDGIDGRRNHVVCAGRPLKRYRCLGVPIRFVWAGTIACVVVASAILLLAGCAVTDDYYPMTPGSSWDYYQTGLGVAPGGTAADTLETEESNVSATRDVQLTSGVSAVEFVTTTTFRYRLPFWDTTGTTTDTTYILETDSAILCYGTLSSTVPDTLLMLPLRVGRHWQSPNGVTTVVGRDDATLAKRTYRQCWKLESEDSTTVWYANGVGQVAHHAMVDIVDQSGNLLWNVNVNRELTACRVK